ncbi:hypothetical protein E9232_004878 [Inquilinus ginsengisoli]|uniref:Uncharacterized protein n=1 Tax=Inquilinus ginsengisoli TaxID=363840 RepID=A0ABU1JUQ1_9PROT|nr:hypothetical protein [Inquilinus ginsengisoli]MDR6292338.1 hypothetical protein [Inquilinus ginsengisoli]
MIPHVTIDPRAPIYAREQRPRLQERIRDSGSNHLIPILQAVDGADTLFMVISQCPPPAVALRFAVPADRSAIVMIGDDYDEALGPKAFHKPSVRDAIRAAVDVVIVSSRAEPPVYCLAAFAAVQFQRPVIIIETRLECEQPWTDCVRSVDVSKHITLCTVRPMGNA